MERARVYFFGKLFHVTDDGIVALWVKKKRKAPGVLEGDEVGLLGVVVEVDGSEAPDLLAGHLGAIYALLERWWEHCQCISLIA